ncbi:MAG: hypothetical protein JXR84_24895, partial [Anaerolineae bacterium]|nr:hypothetical protein [Anaerolineae bacterium]
TPEPAPTATAPDASPTPVSVVVLMNPVLAPTATPEPVAEEPPLYDPSHILDSYAEFLSGGSFSSKTIIATTQVANGESITVDGDAALKYLTKQNVFIGGAVNVAVRTLIRGSSLEFPAVGFYGIPAGTKLDIAAANAAAGEKGFVVLDQQAFRQDDDPLSKTMMLAYDQLLKSHPNLQFLVLLSHGADGKIRAVAYLYEATSPQESMTLSGAPLNFDGCPPDVQLVMMAATYDWQRQTVEFH